jgi:aspartyl-tRNA(Asn)/glutamyl-tRNA(Gln) amidotransferase subunit A
LKSYNRVTDIQTDLQSGSVSCVELIEYYLKNIQEKSHLNAFNEVWADEAREKAILIDAKIKAGQAGSLAGVVIALKDNMAYKDHKVSASSKILEGFESLYTATAVERLEKEDAIFIGRTNCDEFAMGASNENSAFGSVKNPHDETKVPGGSSGGSAVAVAANMCHCSLGSDTGGSIRQPAAFNGIYGLKPTYGRISRWGLLAYASSFDQIGPFTKSIEDIALLTSIMSGKDDHDATLLQESSIEKWSHEVKQNQTFAVMNQAVNHEGLDPAVKASFTQLLEKLQSQGHNITYFDFPLLDQMVPTYYVLTTAEASSNLSRYSGMMYGYRSDNATDLESTYIKSRTEGFGPEVKRRIMLGTFVLSSDQYDAYYEKALKVRRIIQQQTDQVLDNADAILLPTTSSPAFGLGEKSKDPVSMYLADLFTVQANLAGNPAISIPVSKTSEGLPLGVQLMTPRGTENDLYSLSRLIEEVNA